MGRICRKDGWPRCLSLLRRFLPDDAFRGARDAFVFFLIAITSCVPAATVGALSMLLGGRIDADAFGANWITWLLGDLAGEVIIFPLLVALAKRRWMPITVARLFELLGEYLSPIATPPSNRRYDLVPILCRNDVRRIGVSVPSPHRLAGFSTGC